MRAFLWTLLSACVMAYLVGSFQAWADMCQASCPYAPLLYPTSDLLLAIVMVPMLAVPHIAVLRHELKGGI